MSLIYKIGDIEQVMQNLSRESGEPHRCIFPMQKGMVVMFSVRMLFIGLVVFCVAVSADMADAADKIDKDGYILEWLVLGPIRDTGDGATAIKIDYLKDAGEGSGGEAAPTEGDKVIIGPNDEELTWERINFQEMVDSGDIPGPAVAGNNLNRESWGGAAVDNACAYFVTYLFYKEGGIKDFILGSDGTVTVWVNGEERWFNPIKRGWGGDEDPHAGAAKINSWNTYTVEICETGGSWALTVKAITPIDDVSTDPKVLSVEPLDKLTTTWGLIKSKF